MPVPAKQDKIAVLLLCANSQHQVGSLRGRSHHWGIITHALAAALIAAFTSAPTLFLLERTEGTAATYKAFFVGHTTRVCLAHTVDCVRQREVHFACGTTDQVGKATPSAVSFFLVSSPRFYYKLTVCIAMVYSVISSTFYCDQQLLELLALLAELLVGVSECGLQAAHSLACFIRSLLFRFSHTHLYK